MKLGELLPETFYARDAVLVARELVGALLVRDEVVLRVTEVEAYCWPRDSACHNRFGRTARNAAMWGPPGRAYVYLCYGLHNMLNLVTNPEDEAAAVLIRACEPLRGLVTVEARRGGRSGPVLLTGPGKVAAALALDLGWNHHPVWSPGGLEVRRGDRVERLLVGPRVGIDYADPADRDAPWRFALPETRWVSQPKGLKLEPARSQRGPRAG